MDNTPDIDQIFETFLSTVWGCLQKDHVGDNTWKLLISNVEIYKKNELILSPSMVNHLSNIVIHCSRKCYEHSSKIRDVVYSSSIFDAIAAILNVLDLNRVVSTIATALPKTIHALESTLEGANNDERRGEILLILFRLLDVLFTHIVERESLEYSSVLAANERTTFEKLLSRVLLYEDPKLRVYSLSVMKKYYCFTRSTFFVDEIRNNVVHKLVEDESSAQMCLAVLTHLFRSQVELKEKSTSSNCDEFWIVLKKCFHSDVDTRKRALPVLKYVIFNSDFHSDYRAWWKTYFTIYDILDEKQSHLVLPALKLMKTLSNCEVEVDDFWLLNLTEQATLHDSRTVRMKALEHFFELDVNRFREDHVQILVKIMRACNDSTLFRKILQTQSLDAFKNSFKKWMNALDTTPFTDNFNKLLLDDIMNQKWSPVPLYYVLEILSEHPRTCSKFICDQKAKTFIQSVTRMHNICIRSAAQNLFLRILLKCEDCDFYSVVQIFEFLNFCNEKECLQRETRTWSEICEIIRSRITFPVAEKWIMKEFSLKLQCDDRSSDKVLSSLARNFVLLHDALKLFDKSNLVREHFVKITTFFKTAKSDPYVNTKVLDNNLKFLVNLSEYFAVDNLISSNYVDIVTYTFERIEKNSSNLTLVDFYMFCLKKITPCCFYKTDKNLSSLVNNWLPKICRDVSSYSCLMLMEWVREISQSKIHVRSEDWRNIIDSKTRNYVNECKEESFILDCGKSQMNGSVSVPISNYMNTFWRLFTSCTKTMSETLQDYFDPTTVFDLVFEAFHLARNENLLPLFEALKYICRNNVVLNCEQSMIRIIDYSWNKLEEIQATPYYQSAVYQWIKTFIQRSLLQCNVYHYKIEFCVNEFLEKAAKNGGQSFDYVAAVLKQLSEIEDVHLVYHSVIRTFVNAFCTVHMSRKDQRVEYDTMNRIRLLQVEYLAFGNIDADFIGSSEEVRLLALNLILRTIEAEHSPDICITTIETLTRIDDGCKKRYFGDSLYHRTKHKQLQLLLVLEFTLNRRYKRDSLSVMKCFEKMYDFAVRSLLGEPHQPSIRYMLEWLLTLLVIHNFSRFEDKFWSSFSEASEERIGSICSFIMVAFHLANTLKNESFVDKAVKSTLPWSMAQHFNARLYAQSVLVKLINLNEKIKQEYQILENSLVSCLKRGNAVKNSIKLQEDFYFSHFNPVENFSFQTILWELPRLSNISRDEWIPIDLYSQFLPYDYGVPLFESEANSLSKFECSSWITKASTTANESCIEVGPDVSETQRKFIPFSEDIMTSQISRQLKERSDLIVVGSLIDRMPNLGGLTRTCEIFAVSALVLDSLDIVRNKEFTSLSITAEKHVPLIEVKRYNLFSFLKSMKEKQYCVVGIEQATSSRSLKEFIFPSRSIIVLGNEKEGISADLLPVLDVCIEIPQVGVIRSLNVHVSASLIIWEYAKQHIFIS